MLKATVANKGLGLGSAHTNMAAVSFSYTGLCSLISIQLDSASDGKNEATEMAATRLPVNRNHGNIRGKWKHQQTFQVIDPHTSLS